MNVMDMFSLKGKVAVVTGGAGKYGRQIVDALAEAGAETWLASRNLANCERAAAELRGQGYQAQAVGLDQGDAASVLAARDAIAARSGRVDVLVNNAVARPMKKQWDDDPRAFDESMHVNATGLFVVTREFGWLMERQRAGSIVNIASMMGLVGVETANYKGTTMGGFAPDYFFHKGGMINFTRLCASYFGRFNVRCNAVSPGGLLSPEHPEPFVRQYSERTQLGRLANDTDLKGVIVFLASDASAYVTGANIPVDGGYTAK